MTHNIIEYRIAQFPMTLNDLRGDSTVASFSDAIFAAELYSRY